MRQLQNFIERLVVLATDPVIRADQVKRELAIQIGFKTQTGTSDALAKVQPAAVGATQFAPTELRAMILPLDHEMRAAEKQALERALVHCKGNRSLAARLLGVSRSTLYAKLQEHGMV